MDFEVSLLYIYVGATHFSDWSPITVQKHATDGLRKYLNTKIWIFRMTFQILYLYVNFIRIFHYTAFMGCYYTDFIWTFKESLKCIQSTYFGIVLT